MLLDWLLPVIGASLFAVVASAGLAFYACTTKLEVRDRTGGGEALQTGHSASGRWRGWSLERLEGSVDRLRVRCDGMLKLCCGAPSQDEPEASPLLEGPRSDGQEAGTSLLKKR
jgi:hypothetical protein